MYFRLQFKFDKEYVSSLFDEG